MLGSGILGSRVQAKLCVEVFSQGPDATIGRKASSSSTPAHTQDTQKSVKRSRDSMEGAEDEDRVEDGLQDGDQPAFKKMEMGDFVAMPAVEDGESSIFMIISSDKTYPGFCQYFLVF